MAFSAIVPAMKLSSQHDELCGELLWLTRAKNSRDQLWHSRWRCTISPQPVVYTRKQCLLYVLKCCEIWHYYFRFSSEVNVQVRICPQQCFALVWSATVTVGLIEKSEFNKTLTSNNVLIVFWRMQPMRSTIVFFLALFYCSVCVTCVDSERLLLLWPGHLWKKKTPKSLISTGLPG